VNEDEEENVLHLNVENNDIQNITDVNIDEIKDGIDIKEIIKECKCLFFSLSRE
jgi:hypothetical protein